MREVGERALNDPLEVSARLNAIALGLREFLLPFNAREVALPDFPLNSRHSHPGDSPVKMALRSILRSCVWCPDRWSR
jgi:hypothetical protein